MFDSNGAPLYENNKIYRVPVSRKPLRPNGKSTIFISFPCLRRFCFKTAERFKIISVETGVYCGADINGTEVFRRFLIGMIFQADTSSSDGVNSIVVNPTR